MSGAFTGWGVHIVGRPDVEEPQVVGLAVTNVVAGAADLFFYGIPGTNAASATFAAAIERVDLPSDTSAAVALAGGTAGSVAQGTRFTIAATGLVEGGVYRVTVTGEDDGDSSLTCSETVVFNALADYAEASTSSTGATAAQDGPYTVWTFTDTESEGVFTVTRAGTARILVVGGGGGGGGGDSTATNEGDTRRGGGGGGGGEVVETELYLQPGDYFVTVGAGGASVGSFTVGLPGGYSTFAGLVTAYGGGGGGARAKRNNSDGQYVDPGANGGGAAGQGATAAAEIAFVADTAKITGKSPRGVVETIYVDTGFISQNIYLHCASEGLATVVRAMVPKESLATALGLAPTQEITLVQTVGWAQ